MNVLSLDIYDISVILCLSRDQYAEAQKAYSWLSGWPSETHMGLVECFVEHRVIVVSLVERPLLSPKFYRALFHELTHVLQFVREIIVESGLSSEYDAHLMGHLGEWAVGCAEKEGCCHARHG